LVIVALLTGFVLMGPNRAPTATAWQEAPAGVQAEVLASREAVRLEFPEFREKPSQQTMPSLLWAQRLDDYGRFRLVSSGNQEEAAWVRVR
jgi:hypothetical protein